MALLAGQQTDALFTWDCFFNGKTNLNAASLSNQTPLVHQLSSATRSDNSCSIFTRMHKEEQRKTRKALNVKCFNGHRHQTTCSHRWEQKPCGHTCSSHDTKEQQTGCSWIMKHCPGLLHKSKHQTKWGKGVRGRSDTSKLAFYIFFTQNDYSLIRKKIQLNKEHISHFNSPDT